MLVAAIAVLVIVAGLVSNDSEQGELDGRNRVIETEKADVEESPRAAETNMAMSATPTHTPTVTPTPTVTHSQMETPAPTPTYTPTPLPPPEDFSLIVQEYDRDKNGFESKYVDTTVYVRGQIFMMSERGNGYVIVFDGAGLNLVCELPASALSRIMGLYQGASVVVYGHAKLDPNFLSDTDLLIESCNIANP